MKRVCIRSFRKSAFFGGGGSIGSEIYWSLKFENVTFTRCLSLILKSIGAAVAREEEAADFLDERQNHLF